MLLPSNILVRSGHKLPTEAVPPNTLAYYIPTSPKLPEGYFKVKDIREVLVKWMDKASVPTYGGATTSLYATGSKWEHVGGMSDISQDQVYELGYNSILFKLGLGPVIWGNHIAGSKFHLPELVTVVDIFVSATQVLRSSELQRAYEIHEWLYGIVNTAVYNRGIYKGSVQVVENTVNVTLQSNTTLSFLNLSVNTSYLNPPLQALDKHTTEMMDTIAGLYPTLCTKHSEAVFTFNGWSITGVC